MNLSGGLKGYFHILSSQEKIVVDKDTQKPYVSNGIFMPGTLKLVGRAVNPWGIIIAWSCNGLAFTSSIVNNDTAMTERFVQDVAVD